MSLVKKYYEASNGNFEDFSKKYVKILLNYLENLDHKTLLEIKNIFDEAKTKRKKIFFAGNGGSAATASHSVCDYAIGPREFENGFRCISLNDNIPSITALSNDIDYSEVFSKQISNLGDAGDVLVVISASGNSENLVKAVDTAKSKGLTTIGWTGFDGGRLASIVDCNLLITAEKGDYGPVEDLHLIVNHILANFFIEKIRFKK
mgnify:FL=1|tara:strand:+ start:3310 stop:3924 length:615 start_codon:yes stop_codon:yes gene_type:complete